MEFNPTFPETYTYRTGGFINSVFAGTRLDANFPGLDHGLCCGDAAFAGYCLDAPSLMPNGRTYFNEGRVQIGATKRD